MITLDNFIVIKRYNFNRNIACKIYNEFRKYYVIKERRLYSSEIREFVFKSYYDAIEYTIKSRQIGGIKEVILGDNDIYVNEDNLLRHGKIFRLKNEDDIKKLGKLLLKKRYYYERIQELARDYERIQELARDYERDLKRLNYQINMIEVLMNNMQNFINPKYNNTIEDIDKILNSSKDEK